MDRHFRPAAPDRKSLEDAKARERERILQAVRELDVNDSTNGQADPSMSTGTREGRRWSICCAEKQWIVIFDQQLRRQVPVLN